MSVTPLINGRRRYSMAIHGRSYSTRQDRYLMRRQLREARRRQRGQGYATLASVAHHENLIAAYRECRRGGEAPGIDGITYNDMGGSEVAEMLRQVSRAIMAGTYRPYPCRAVRIPKRRNGYRTLRLRVIADRVVEKAIAMELGPYLDRTFLTGSWGFRPGRNIWGMLAAIEHTIVSGNQWVIAIDDIRDAFENVPLGPLMQMHQHVIRDPGLLWLIERVFRGGDRVDRQAGIIQGGAYSPTALNLFLHFAHDLAFERDLTRPPWLRYADNLVYLTQDVPAGQRALATAASLLEPYHMQLKGDDGPPVDLRDDGQVHLLGFILRSRDDGSGIKFLLGESAWEGLDESLLSAHDAEDPNREAQGAIRGWVEACGPACDSTTRTDLVERILMMATDLGFRELCSSTELDRWLEQSHLRWLECRAAAERQATTADSQQRQTG